ncbi:MAG: serine hydrolase domain-containing protein [Candidatus Symbiobacter sp.]|nr:serine hydrolase domain-containing protein [Candidatus Symbiobacter sp.]
MDQIIIAKSSIEVDPLLVVNDRNRATWLEPENRRYGFHNLDKISRYGMSFRAAQILPLPPTPDPTQTEKIAALPEVQALINNPNFSAMGVMRGDHLLFTAAAPDFDVTYLHSMQSINKTMINLLIAPYVEHGEIKLNAPIKEYLPQLGAGYEGATVQMLLDMAVANDYSEDMTDHHASYYAQEEALGWRLPLDLNDSDYELRHRDFLCQVGRRPGQTAAPLAFVDYKSSNTEILAWLIETVSGYYLNLHLAELVDAIGLEQSLFIGTDRDGVPAFCGGAAMSLLDLLRYGALFVRRGVGVNGWRFGSDAWFDATLKGGIAWKPTEPGYRYSNHCETDGRALAHGGFCGQYLYCDLTSKMVVGFYSVSLAEAGVNPDHFHAIYRMMHKVTRLFD